MNWMIVGYNASERRWDILHYSHDFPDAYDTYVKMRATNPEIKLMIEISQVVSLEIHEQIYALRKQVLTFEAEYRKKHHAKISIEGLGDRLYSDTELG